MRIRRVLRQLPIQVFLIFWTLVAIVPFILISLLAFRSQQDIFLYPLGIGGSFTPQNFVSAWLGPSGNGVGMGNFLKNSGIIAVTALATTLVLGVPAAYFSNHLGLRLRRGFLAVFICATVVPFVLLIVPYYNAFSNLGLLSSPGAVGVAYGVLALPTTVLVLNAYFSQFPSELLEAASIDGLNRFMIFLRIVLPLSSGAVVGVSMLTLVFAWGETQLGIALLQDPSSESVAVGVLGFEGNFTTQLGPIFAGLSLASVPIVILYLFFNRFISKGIALGGVFR